MNKKSISAILAVAVVILFGVAFYFKTIDKISKPGVPAPSVVQQPAPISAPAVQQAQSMSDKTKGWNTYTNNRYGYTISYPSNWFADTTSSEEPVAKRGGPGDANAEFLGGDTSWSNYKGSFDLESVPEDIQTIFLMISRQDNATTLDEYLKAKNFDFTNKETVQINGITGVRISGGSPDASGQDVEHIILMKNGLFFIFSNGAGKKSADARDVLETMISTLKFTN